MTRGFAICFSLMLGSAIQAQDITTTPLEPLNPDANIPSFNLDLDLDAAGVFDNFREIEEVEETQASVGIGATLRGLDRVSGELTDLDLLIGQSTQFGRMLVTLDECRYPTDNPSGDAFAYLKVANAGDGQPLFQGWMIASSPALNAMDHPRYDVWLLRCTIS